MATKDQTQENQEVDYSQLSLDDFEALEKAEEIKRQKIAAAKAAKLNASKQEAFDALLNVVNKYKLSGEDVINTLLAKRKMKFKEVQEIKPLYLVDATVTKEGRNGAAASEGHFYFYEGKVILADKAYAEKVCSSGIDAFKAVLTEAGKQYLANDDLKNIVINFYNTYKPATATKWDGK